MYAGTGEGFFPGDAIRGAGVFKSTDGGTTWAQLGSTSTSGFWYVNRLASSPDGGTLLAATWDGIFQSTNGDFKGLTLASSAVVPAGVDGASPCS
jgi:hypothetical protein